MKTVYCSNLCLNYDPICENYIRCATHVFSIVIILLLATLYDAILVLLKLPRRTLLTICSITSKIRIVPLFPKSNPKWVQHCLCADKCSCNTCDTCTLKIMCREALTHATFWFKRKGFLMILFISLSFHDLESGFFLNFCRDSWKEHSCLILSKLARGLQKMSFK